jgi:small-conductance mechanosensitive channel
MGNLAFEILLRLAKAAAAFIVGAIIYAVCVGPLQAPPSVELLLLSWISGAAFILLVESSPI